jgi:hypothetical protein
MHPQVNCILIDQFSLVSPLSPVTLPEYRDIGVNEIEGWIARLAAPISITRSVSSAYELRLIDVG